MLGTRDAPQVSTVILQGSSGIIALKIAVVAYSSDFSLKKNRQKRKHTNTNTHKTLSQTHTTHAVPDCKLPHMAVAALMLKGNRLHNSQRTN